jgi:hypothetical protein
VVPLLAVSVVGNPLQMVTFEPPLIAGSAFTLTNTVAVLMQPVEASVPVTV